MGSPSASTSATTTSDRGYAYHWNPCPKQGFLFWSPFVRRRERRSDYLPGRKSADTDATLPNSRLIPDHGYLVFSPSTGWRPSLWPFPERGPAPRGSSGRTSAAGCGSPDAGGSCKASHRNTGSLSFCGHVFNGHRASARNMGRGIEWGSGMAPFGGMQECGKHRTGFRPFRSCSRRRRLHLQ